LVARDRAAAAGDLRLVLPQSYMNESGYAVAALARFYRLSAPEILVAHDELDLKPGSVKLKLGGGSAGHNGLKDVIAQLGGGEFWRLRLGIGHPRDGAPAQQEVVDYVLHPPRPEEKPLIDDAIGRALAIWPRLAAGEIERAMHELHTRPPRDPAEGPARDEPEPSR
jgi:PTH1 family peptidyl-tRNA hydrolase